MNIKSECRPVRVGPAFAYMFFVCRYPIVYAIITAMNIITEIAMRMLNNSFLIFFFLTNEFRLRLFHSLMSFLSLLCLWCE